MPIPWSFSIKFELIAKTALSVLLKYLFKMYAEWKQMTIMKKRNKKLLCKS